MAEITLVLGGTRSGKSGIAESIVLERGGRPVYLATCEPRDPELVERVRIHRERRSKEWISIEEPLDPATALAGLSTQPSACLIECLSFLIFNRMNRGDDETTILDGVDDLLAFAKRAPYPFVVVSNDVSGALIPPDDFSRRYQSILGRSNQRAAAAADKAILAVAGLALRLKG